MFIHIWSSLATLTLRHAAVTYNRGSQGMKAWSSCWIGSCQQSGPSHPRSGGIVPFGTVARNTHRNARRCYSKLPVWLRLPSFPWCLKDTYHYHLGCGGGWGDILIVPPHYMPDSCPWPLKDTYHYHLGWGWWWWWSWWRWWWWWWSWWSWWRWWSFPVRANDGVWP